METRSSNHLFLAWALLIILSLIWGSSFILMKKGLLAFSPAEIAALRILSASLFLLPVAIRNLREIRSRKQWVFLFASGFLGSLIPAFLFPLAQTRIDSAITGVLNALTPFFTILIGAAFFSARFNNRVKLGILVGFIGSILLVTAGMDGRITNINFYALLVVLATILYGMNVNIIKYYLGEIRPVHITSFSMMMIGPFALLYLLWYADVRDTLQQDPRNFIPLGYIIFLGVAGTAIALILFNKLVKITNIVFSSSVTYLIPIVAVIWGLIDQEILLFQHYLGMIFIILGVLLANLGGRIKYLTKN
jgi:drug/metabolite transporter (DMT)-like permease